MEVPSSGVCVVCGKVVNNSLVSVHASLIAQNGSIHSKMGQVVGMEQLEEACIATQFVCSICLKLLLNIVNLECKVIVLKNEFRGTFQQGTQSRKRVVAGGKGHLSTQRSISDGENGFERLPQDETWNTTSLNHYVKDEKVEEFLSNIPVDTDNSSTMAFLSSDNTVNDRTQGMMSLIKDESPGSENTVVTSKFLHTQLNTQLTLDTNSTGELSDLLPSQCLVGSDATCHDSQDEEKAFNDTTKRSETGDSSTHDYPHTPFITGDTMNTAQLMECNTEGEKTCNTHNTMDKEDNECVPHLGGDSSFERDSDHTPQGTIRQSKGKPGSHTPKRRKRKMNTMTSTEEERTQTQDEGMSKDSETTQLEDLVMTCELCGGKFSDANQLGRHRREAHSAVYCHVCDLCPNTCYREKSKLTQHLQRNHKITAHKCLGCSHQAVSQNALDQHIIREHPESRFFECHICHKAFRTHRYLHIVHIKRCHLGLPVKYSCEKCNKGFVDKSSFENHKLTHSQTRNFPCEYCGSSFLTPYALKVHVNTHTRERKYQCEDCGSAFLRMCNLCAHRRRFHSSSDVKLVCEVCGKSMATRKDLKRHQVAQHSKEKPFKCPHCTRCYAAKESLKSHLRTHTGEKPYVCGCGKAFHKSNVLRRHQRCVHEGEDLQQNAAVAAAAAEADSVQVGGDGEIEREEHMVVITLKECNPPGVYTVQSDTPHLQEILVSSEESTEGSADATLLAEGPDGLPLLHSSLGTLGRARLALSTPVLLTSLTAIPNTTFATQVTTVDTSLATHPDNTFHTAPLSPASNEAIVHPKDPDEPQDALDGLGSASCSDLLQLPGLHTAAAAAAATSVSLVTPWPSSAL